jgi:hypothetical protein
MASAWRMMQRLARGLVRLKAKIKAGSPYFSQNFILRFASESSRECTKQLVLVTGAFSNHISDPQSAAVQRVFYNQILFCFQHHVDVRKA